MDLIYGLFLGVLFVSSCTSEESKDVKKRSPVVQTPLGVTYPVRTAKEIRQLQETGVLAPGDVIEMQNGIWESQRIIVNVSGTEEAGRRIYLTAQTPGGVSLRGKSYIRMNGNYIEVRGALFEGTSWEKHYPFQFSKNTHHNRVTNCLVRGFNREDSVSTKHYWVELWGSYHTVDWNAFEGKGMHNGEIVRVKGDPSEVRESWGHYIANNYFGARPDVQTNSAEAIQIGMKNNFQDLETVVENNVFYNYDGEIETISVKGSNCTLQYNTFIQSKGLLCLRAGDRNVVQGNYFFCDNKKDCGGIRIHGNDHRILNNYVEGEYSASMARGSMIVHSGNPEAGSNGDKRRTQRSLIAFNSFVKCRRCIIIGEGGEEYPRDNIISNNVVWGENPLVTLIDIEDGAVDNAHNTLFESNIVSNGYSFRTGNGIRQTAPRLVRHPVFQYYTPSAESTALIRQARGEYRRATTEDISGRWRAMPTDIGAALYEANTNEIPTRRPLGPSDVGPDWYTPTLINPQEHWEQYDFSHYDDFDFSQEGIKIPKVKVKDGKVIKPEMKLD
ncbi:unnamed protein product [Owenia fusiformis]|uniref:Uncharacterized protein n=1 Tax=Owenia fusiformis TaxID=6347 RepID=A0A8J1UHX2_OWEFU|nr:unnamed protein product [Owenia fusiformis]